MPRTPKLEKSSEGAPITKVTRSSRRAGSVDQELDHTRTPLKSNLESISETGSIDSLTPRRSTRRSIAAPDLSTPIKKSQLTKENVARLENLEDSIENSPSGRKRITRRTSITSEDVPMAKKPFIRLVRSKLATQTEEIIEQPPTKKSQTTKSITIETQSKDEDKVALPIRTRRTSTKGSSTPEQNSKSKPVDSSTNDKPYTPSSNTTTGRTIHKKNPTSTPITETAQKMSPKTVEIINCSDNSDNSDKEDSEEQYYRNTSLKKFTGTSKNIVIESEPVSIETSFAKQNTSLNDEKSAESNLNTKVNTSLSYKSKLSLNNLSNFEEENVNHNESQLQSQTQNNIDAKQQTLNAKKDVNDVVGTGFLEAADQNTLIDPKQSPKAKQDVKEVPETDVIEAVDQNTLNKKTLATPVKEINKAPGSSRKSTPKSNLATPVQLVNPVIDVQVEPKAPAKLATPTKSVTPVKLASPVILLSPVTSQEATSTNPASPFKRPTPVKTNSSLKQTGNLTFGVVDSVDESGDISVMKSPIAKIIPESPIKSNSTINITQHIEVTGNGSRILLKQEDDVYVQIPVDSPSKLDNSTRKSIISTSFSSSDDQNNDENKSPDGSFTETFENFSDNIAMRKAKSCSPQTSKKFVQSQPISSSFSGGRHQENKLDLNEIADSKKTSGTIHDETEFVGKVETSITEMSSTKRRQRDSAEMESIKQKFSSNDAGSAKKMNPRSLAISESSIDISLSASGSFIEVDNTLEQIVPSSAKKPKPHSSGSAPLERGEKTPQRSLLSLTEPTFEVTDDKAEVPPGKPTLSKSETGSAKKMNRRSLSISESVIRISSPSGSFIETDNKLVAESLSVSQTGPSSSKKPKPHNSGSFIEEDNHDEAEPVELAESPKAEIASPKKPQRSSVSLTESKSGYFEETDNYAEPSKEKQSKSETGSTKKMNRGSFSIPESGVRLNSSASGSFIEADNNLEAEPSSAKKSKRRSSLTTSFSDELPTKDLDGGFVTKRKHKSPYKQPSNERNVNDETTDLLTASIEDSAPTEQTVSSEGNKPLKKTPLKSVIPRKPEISLKVIQAKCDEILKERELARKALRDEFAKKKDKKPKKKERKRSPSPVKMKNPIQQPLKQLSPKPTKLVNLDAKFKPNNPVGKERKLDKHVETSNCESFPIKQIKKRNAPDKIQSKPNRLVPDVKIDHVAEITKSRRLPEDILTQLDDKSVNSVPAKKFKLPIFEEKEKTPEIRPSGFKVSPITPKILSNNFRVSLVPKQKVPKRKLKFKEPTNVLPQLVWTSVGFFEESDVGPENIKNLDYHSTTNFIVEDIGSQMDRAAGYSKADKHRKAELKEFKQKNLFRSNVPRADAKHVLKSKNFEKANIKFISK